MTKYKGCDDHVVIPEGVTRIGAAAFAMCGSLQSVSLPERDGSGERYRDWRELLPFLLWRQNRHHPRLRRDIDERRKEIKKAHFAPYQDFEAQVKELLAMVDAPLEEIKSFVSGMEEREKEAKRREIVAYFHQQSGPLGAPAGRVLGSPAFFEGKWLNKSISAKTWRTAMDEKITKAAWDLNSIQTTAGPHAGAVTAKYLETLSTEGLAAYRDQLAALAGPEAAPVSTDLRQGSLTLRLSGGVEALTQALEALSMLGTEGRTQLTRFSTACSATPL